MVTYEYRSSGSPVLMYEKVNGFTVNEYTAYIDRHGNSWVLYPRRSVRPSNEVTFTKKTVSVRNAIILPPEKPITVKGAWEKEKPSSPSPDEQVTLI